MEFRIIENELLPIYENERKEKLVNARELHTILKNKRKFTDWIKQRIEQYEFIKKSDFISFSQNCEKPIGGRPSLEYYITVDMAKQLSMVENNGVGKQMRKYFIEVEKRYRTIVESPTNIFDFMRLAIDQMESNQKEIQNVKLISEDNARQIKEIQSKIDVIIKNDYCLASDIAEQLKLYSESGLPHSNLIGAIGRKLGYKTSYKHYYEDKYIAIVPDISKGNNFWQVYYKPIAVKEIMNWFEENKEDMEYTVIYQKNTKNGVKGEIKEKGIKIDDVCYKIKIEIG